MNTKLILSLSVSMAFLGCQRPHDPSPSQALDQWVGVTVTVQFRRDMLGASGNPIAPNATWLNDTKVSLDGNIVSVHEDGFFFDCHYKMNSGDTDLRHSEFWIPRNSILAIEKKL